MTLIQLIQAQWLLQEVTDLHAELGRRVRYEDWLPRPDPARRYAVGA